jgi:hypothetical protein
MLWLIREPAVWAFLDAPHLGQGVAALRFAWIWLGLTFVVLRGGAGARRLFSAGVVLLGAFLIAALTGHRDIYAGAWREIYAKHFNTVLLRMTAFLWAAAVVAWAGRRVSRRSRPSIHPD